MDGQERVHCLKFQKQSLLKDHISPEANLDKDPFVMKRDFDLPLKLNATELQFMRQAGFISAFERLDQARNARKRRRPQRAWLTIQPPQEYEF